MLLEVVGFGVLIIFDLLQNACARIEAWGVDYIRFTQNGSSALARAVTIYEKMA